MAGLCYNDPTFLLFHIDASDEAAGEGTADAYTQTVGLHVFKGNDACSRAYSATAVIYVGFLALGLLYCLKQLCWTSNKFSMHKEVIQTCFLSIVVARLSRLALLYLQAGDHILMHILFLAPLSLSFVSSTVLFVTWFDVLAYVSGKGQEGASRVFYGTLAFDVLVLFVNFVLLCIDARLSALPVIIGAFVYDLASLKQLFVRRRNDKVRWDSATAKQFSGLTSWVLLACFSVLLMTATQLSFGVSSYWIKGYYLFLVKQLVWTASEVVLLVSLLGVLSNLSFVTTLGSPKSASDVTSEWMTGVLRESSTIDDDVHVAPFPSRELEQLRGGCHSDVRKLELLYEDNSGEALDQLRAPSTVVVKFLYWHKPFWEKLKVFATYKIPGLHSKEADYVKSYKIESYFYDRLARDVRGIQLPRIYFNYADTFNVHFGVVMEDVTKADSSLEGGVISGQPYGFTFDESRVIFMKLARFHAHFWQDDSLSSLNVWDIGGFWTGDKREAVKSTVATAWEKVYTTFGASHKSAVNGSSSPQLSVMGDNANFPACGTKQTSTFPPSSIDDSTDALAGLGLRLERNAGEIKKVYSELCSGSSPFVTLIHGDFKISNLFIDSRASTQTPVGPSYALPKTCDAMDRSVWTIDWQWVGKGIAAIDVAYFLCTSTRADLLSRSAFKKQVKLYYSVILEKGVRGISFKELWRQVRLCVVDFVVYCIVSKWCSMAAEDFEKNQAECKDGMQIRSLQHMHRLIDVTLSFLDDMGFN